MFTQIISRTPPWVFALLAILLALGAAQLRQRTASLTRVTALPVGMLLWAVTGVGLTFGTGSGKNGLLALALAMWATGAAGTALWVLARPPADDGTRYDATRQQFTLPGSAVPLLLILGIFATKYAVGVTLGLHPALVGQPVFAAGVSGLYGVFSGVFVGRGLRLWRLAQHSKALPAQQAA